MRRFAKMAAATLSIVLLTTMLAGPAMAQDETYPPTTVAGPIDDEIGVGGGGVAGPTAQGPTAEVAGAQETNDADLAFTGSEVSVPLAAGAVLIGFGGLLSLAANKRRRQLI